MTVAILPSPSFAPFRPALALGLRLPSASRRLGLSPEPGFAFSAFGHMPSPSPQKAADGSRQPPAPACPPDGGMTDLDPRLSLAPA